MAKEKNIDERLILEYGDVDINSKEEKIQSQKEYLKNLKTKYEKIIKNEEAREDNDMKRYYSSILGFAIGDAYGVPYEFKKRGEFDVSDDMIGYKSHNVPAGTWSDDTSMVLATLDSIADTGSIDYKDIMNKFCKWYINGKYTADGNVYDIGITTKKSLDRYLQSKKATKSGSKNFSDNGNGSLMRMLPVAIYFHANDIELYDEVQITYYISSLTHANDISILGCKIYSDYMKNIFDGKSPKEAYLSICKTNYDDIYEDTTSFYSRILNGTLPNLTKDEIKSSGYIVDTLESAIWSAINTGSYEESVKLATSLGNDTDTIAALTGSITAPYYGVENIPQKWQDGLINKQMLDKIFDKFEKKTENEIVDKPKKIR